MLLFLLAFLLGVPQYVAVFAIAYGALRIFSFGVHLESSLLCTLIGLIYYLGSTYLSLSFIIPLAIKIVLLILCLGAFVVYAPAQTKKRPISPKQKSLLKTKSLCVLSVVSLLVFILRLYPVYSNLLCMAVFCQTINLLPITYKLFKEC